MSAASLKFEAEQRKIFLPAMKILEEQKSPVRAVNDPSGKPAAGSHLQLGMGCVDELQVLLSH